MGKCEKCNTCLTCIPHGGRIFYFCDVCNIFFKLLPGLKLEEIDSRPDEYLEKEKENVR